MMKRANRLRGSILICVAILLAPAGLQAQQADTKAEGILHIVWGDPHPEFGSGGVTLYTLELLNGQRVPLQLTGQDTVAAYYFGKRVIVSGHVVQNQLTTANTLNPWAIVVDRIALSTSLEQQAQASVFGSRKVIYLLLRFSDDASVPHPPGFYLDLNNPDTPPVGEVFPATINGFFRKTSWSQFDWRGDVGGVGGVGAPGGWLTLPHPKSYYAPCGWGEACANVQAIADDGTALGRREGITFSNYDNINFVLSNDLDCCAWGGRYYSSVDARSYGATWEPPWGQNTLTYSHEMGHSLGLPHSGWAYYAYDSPWDMMSSVVLAGGQVPCGSYASRNENSWITLYCGEPGDGYIAGHKEYLGWIPPANEVVTDTRSNATVLLEADALPLSSATKMIKICIAGLLCDGSAAHYFTVEARVKGLGVASQYDNGLTGDGVIIHEFQLDRPPIGGNCFFNRQSGWALPIDSTPNDYDSVNCSSEGRTYPNYALFNAQWRPGETYTNSMYGFSVRVVSRTGSTFVVSINGGGPVLSVKPGAVSFGAVGVPGTALQTVRIENIGTTDVTLGAMALGGADPGQFRIPVAKDLCSGQSLAPAQTCTVGVKFKPTNGGPQSADLLIPSSDLGSNVVAVPLDGTGDAPEITVDPMALDYGMVSVGTAFRRTVAVRNDGVENLTLGVLTLEGTNPDQFKMPVGKDLCSGQTLAAGGTCTVAVKFAPGNVGPQEATLVIPSDDFNGNPVTVTLDGTGTAP